MKYVTSKFLMIPVLAVVLTLSAPAASTALACPMCKAANEEDDSKPRAYMYSILFMLTVPATLVSGVTFGLFTMNRKEADALREAGLSDEVADESVPEESRI
ncbi:MAG: hypothetical protein HQ518_25695 [Rhodopirellula sp.]|nr:hypothetical protein [Rhodopirellula sp.]